MKEPRTRHDIFETEFDKSEPFKSWWIRKWCGHLDQYAKWGWAIIPISIRGKRPLSYQTNYPSKGPAGPYLKREEAEYWVSNDFNLAVTAGPSKIIWCDIDDPSAFNALRNHDKLMQFLVMRTPRGYAMPIKDGAGGQALDRLTERGFDFRDDVSYELVPLSETCLNDHHLHGSHHPGPRESCTNGQAHKYYIREWITSLTNPMVTIQEFVRLIS